MTGIFIRNMKSVSWDQQLTRAVTRGANGKKLANIASERFKPLAQKEMERQYATLLSEIGGLLQYPDTRGLHNPRESGARKVSVIDLLGRKIEVSLRYYGALSQDYIRKKPRSVQFWRKTGDLYEHYRLATTNRDKVKAVPGKVREQRVGNKSRYTQRIRFELARLPEPLNTIIVESFISGKESHVFPHGHNYGRNTIGVVVYPEYFRPLLGRVAARLSEDSAEGLRQATTGLSKPK